MNEQYRKLTREELDKLAGQQLPERAAMSLIHGHVAVPVVPFDPGPVSPGDPIVSTKPPIG